MGYHMRHHYSSLLKGTLEKHKTSHFIETGTNLGQGVAAAIAARFDRITSIEVDENLFKEAVRRFADLDHVTIVLGDSAKVLSLLAPTLVEPVTFYLDAHSIESNPLLEELDAIALSPCKEHIILIDDVRMFGTPDWHGLSKVDALNKLATINERYSVTYETHAPGDLLVARL